MGKRATNLSLHPKILELAGKLQTLLGYNSMSTMVEDLIRHEYEKREGIMLLKEPMVDYKISSPPGHIAGIPPAAAGAPVIMPPNLQEEGASADAPDAPGGSTPRVHARKNPPPERRKKK